MSDLFFSAQLRDRIRARFLQKTLAGLIGVSPTLVCRWTYGARVPARYHEQIRAAVARPPFEIDPSAALDIIVAGDVVAEAVRPTEPARQPATKAKPAVSDRRRAASSVLLPVELFEEVQFRAEQRGLTPDEAVVFALRGFIKASAERARSLGVIDA